MDGGSACVHECAYCTNQVFACDGQSMVTAYSLRFSLGDVLVELLE